MTWLEAIPDGIIHSAATPSASVAFTSVAGGRGKNLLIFARSIRSCSIEVVDFLLYKLMSLCNITLWKLGIEEAFSVLLSQYLGNRLRVSFLSQEIKAGTLVP